MDAIEARVIMPDEAPALGGYARYYAPTDQGGVRVVFMEPIQPDPPGLQCEDIENGIVPCPTYQSSYPALKAGQRAWLADDDNLPGISDGGCSVIEFEVPRDFKGRIKVQCNGYA
jgi:hypothetical protein